MSDNARPSLDTEAVSPDEGGYGGHSEGFEEIQVDPSMLDPSCLVPPTIPNTLGAEDIDKVIAALTNVPDVQLPDGFLGDGEKRSQSQDQRRLSNTAENKEDSKDNRNSNYNPGYDNDGGRKNRNYNPFKDAGIDEYQDNRGHRGHRGRGRWQHRGFRRGWRGRGNWHNNYNNQHQHHHQQNQQQQQQQGEGEGDDGTRGRGRGTFPVARGRNIFPEDEERGRGGRGRMRMNNLYKRFVQQHVKKPGEPNNLPEGDLCWNEYGEKRNWQDGAGPPGYRKTRSRSRGRKKGSSSSSRSSSSSSDDSSPKKKKKKKEKKHKKKKKSSTKKKKRDGSTSESEHEVKKEEGPDWRVELLKKMKDIKSLPPEQLETEFKKAMAEKKRREEEEKCIQEIEKRQKLARKVKKESEKAAKKAAKEAKRESKSKEAENEDDGFYGGFHNMSQHMGDPNLPQWIAADAEDEINPFKSGTFAEVPFVTEENAVQEPGMEENPYQEIENNDMPPEFKNEEEMDPYARALSEQLKKEPKDDQGGDVSWPAGAIENTVDDAFEGENKDQTMMEECEEYDESVTIDDNTKSVMNTSKMFSKVRNRIKKRPLNIHLKTAKLEGEEEEGIGLQPIIEREATPGEGFSGEEMSRDNSQFASYYENANYSGNYGGDHAGDEYDMTSALIEGKGRDPGQLLDEEEERRVARYRERARKRRERAKESGELEDGEHSPSPEPERPHHRRRRKRRHEKDRKREGTPLVDEGAGGLEEGEIGDQPDPREESRDNYRDEPPSKMSMNQFRGPPPNGTPGIPFVDTSVPPPSLNGPPLAPPPFMRGQQQDTFNERNNFGPSHGDRNTSLPPSERPGPPGLYLEKRDSPFGPPPVPAQFERQPSRSRSTRFEPTPFSERNAPNSSPLYPPTEAQSASNFPPSPNYNSNFNHPPPVQGPRPHPTSPNYSDGPVFPRAPSPQGRYDAYSGSKYSAPAPPPPVPILAPGSAGPYFDSLPRVKSPDLSSQLEPVDSDEDEDSIDITKVSPIMKYIAGKLSDQKYHLELSGPFKYNSNIPGLSKPLFVAFKMVTMLEEAGYNGSKMYMSAMFPAGIKDTKADLIESVTTGKLDVRIKGNKLVKMCVRCIRCFLAYYTGKNDDIDSSEGECSEGSDNDDEKGRSSKTVKTSMMDILGRIKDEKDEPLDKESADLLSNEAPASITNKRYSVEDNPWSNMELGMRSNNLKTFTALQSHFTKQYVRRGIDPRDAREQASESMMCFVVANFTDTMLRHMVTSWKGEILPDQSQLEVSRSGKEMTLYDQIVSKLLKHQSEFPLSIIQEVKSEPDWKGALLKKMRNIVERMLKFYLKGLGKLGGEKDNSGVQILSDPQELRFNYLPEGLRETEEVRPTAQTGQAAGARPDVKGSNFFNMEQAAVANRSFSSYTRTSLDEQLSPVSPDRSAPPIGASLGTLNQGHVGQILRQKYLFGTFYVDTLLYQGSSYVYELGVYMSDSSSCEVYIVPTKLFKQNSVLEMLGFSYNPDEKKYIYIKPGTAGFSKTYSEEHGLDRIMQFLREKRYDSRGDSENRGLILASQSVEDLATWVKFTSFHRKDWELGDIVSAYSCLDMFIEDSKGLYNYLGPKLHRERDTNQTFFTWEYTRGSYTNEAMSAGKADALYSLVERLLDNRPNFENFFKSNCFAVNSRQYGEVERRFNIIKDMYNLEYHLATSLNVRAEKRRLVTEGIFSPRTTAELGDKPGLVAARMIRILAEFGYSKHSLNSQILEARERGNQFGLPVQRIVEKVRNSEVRQRCEQQVFIVIKYIEDYFLRR